jgi:hypothetical protein
MTLYERLQRLIADAAETQRYLADAIIQNAAA